MYYAVGMSVPSLHRESTDSLIGAVNNLGRKNICIILTWLFGISIHDTTRSKRITLRFSFLSLP